MASLANICSLHVGYYEGRVKLFPFQNYFLLVKSFSTFTFTTVVFCHSPPYFFTAVKVDKKGVVQQQNILEVGWASTKRKRGPTRSSRSHTLLVKEKTKAMRRIEEKIEEEEEI